MKGLALCIATMAGVLFFSEVAQAQWVTPGVVVAPQVQWVTPGVVVAPTPVVRMYRAPVVAYQPMTVVTSRRRPILGGTVIRTNRGYRRVVF